ncbi:hypothetical protein L3Y34_013059 [Caenorhabditis briggsae]|uniref:E3 ubiquitin-protein ligase n=1 Tax=Caenorhabditis briggsae TaxID=6238 RepID=A0AAE9CVW8_CAEBR|nr:hypothetical protein L3Y34_013059 [Caenorhabditis briggsae]
MFSSSSSGAGSSSGGGSGSGSGFPMQPNLPGSHQPRCAICLHAVYMPFRMPCGHINCFNCQKNVGTRCTLCRQEFNVGLFNYTQQINLKEAVHPNYVDAQPDSDGRVFVQDMVYERDEDVKPSVEELKAAMAAAAAAAQPVTTEGKEVAPPKMPYFHDRNSKVFWLYQSRSVKEKKEAWWRFNGRMELDIEEAFQRRDDGYMVYIDGQNYSIDFDEMIQFRMSNPAVSRKIKRVNSDEFDQLHVLGIGGVMAKTGEWEVK